MSCKVGDIILISFPYTDLLSAKKRPVLVVKNENEYGDIVCFQITSNVKQSNLFEIHSDDLSEGELKLRSFVKYDKCFTISTQNADKKLAQINLASLEKIKKHFCDEIF
ncbi:type II toxin-antitoxin system PemK/MazF family toxin [Sulfuricurvum sp.]|uniref:type II toxin-antitoxin system PemK/MazF family toxin n=1 Tax=Sulfuricurvum sp. TaxID=2025608 RepID=UPI003567C528